MKIGWVDFSKKEREKALGLLRLLQETGAIDELGVGIVRDAFADRFFPCISTLMTRAKYFVIVPYIVKESIGEGARKGWTARETLVKINDEERKIGKRLWEMHRDEKRSYGIIGFQTLKHDSWVKRSPSELYWNGIRKLGICGEANLSLFQYINASLQMARLRGRDLGTLRRGEECEGDDLDAGGPLRLKPLDIAEIYHRNWRQNVDIDLSNDEAKYLKRKIQENMPDSLLALSIRNSIDLREFNGSFESFSMVISKFADARTSNLLDLANKFSQTVDAAWTRYNVILQGNRSNEAAERWNEIMRPRPLFDVGYIDRIFGELNLDKPQYGLMFRFLCDIQGCLNHGDTGTLDRLIREREKAIKGTARAKLAHSEKYSKWVGGKLLDFRLENAAQILGDILEADNV